MSIGQLMNLKKSKVDEPCLGFIIALFSLKLFSKGQIKSLVGEIDSTNQWLIFSVITPML